MRDLQRAPRPGDAHNVIVAPPRPLRERLMWIPRVILFVPWVATELAFIPLRTTAYAWMRFKLGSRLAGLPFNDTGRVALYPVLAVEAGYGVDAGALLIGRDVLGAGERVAGELRVGHRVAERYRIDVDTGDRLGPVALLGGALYERRRRAAFTGIGSNDLRDADEVMAPIDPTGDEAVRARYGLRTVRAHGGLRVPLPAGLEARALGGWVSHELRESNALGPGLDIYDTGAIAGVGELDHHELTFDLTLDVRSSRHTPRPAVYADGGLLARTTVTRAAGLPAPAADYTRVLAAITGWASVFGGGRVVSARAELETVTGSVAEVPFYDLPVLGGPTRMRGLRRDRFRDRNVAVVGAEYRFLIGDDVALAAFADAGTVAGSVGALAEDDISVGFGLELSMFGRRSEYLRAHIGSSTERELVINFTLAPEVP